KKPKWLLPAGDYRDTFSERRRADIIVVTKTPEGVTEATKSRIRQKLSTTRDTPILFAGIGYGSLEPVFPEGPPTDGLNNETAILLVTGIANPAPLYGHLLAKVSEIVHVRYPDHHDYTATDIRKTIHRFNEIRNPNKLIITTEKDAQRLLDPTISVLLAELPVYMVPIKLEFNAADEVTFRESVLPYYDSARPHTKH